MSHNIGHHPEVPRGTVIYKTKLDALNYNEKHAITGKMLAGKTAWINQNGKAEEVVMCHSGVWRYRNPQPAAAAA